MNRQTITFKLCDKTQFKCNGLFYWFEIELNNNLIFAVFHLWPLQLLHLPKSKRIILLREFLGFEPDL